MRKGEVTKTVGYFENFLFVILVFFFGLLGCGTKLPRSEDPSTKPTTRSDTRDPISSIPSDSPRKSFGAFVQGDPMNLVAGAISHPETPFTEDQASQLSEYYLVDVLHFSERTESRDPSIKRDIEQENLVPSNNIGGKDIPADQDNNFFWDRVKREAFRMVKTSSGNWNFDSKETRFLVEKQASGFLMMTKWQINGRDLPITPIHFSCSQDCEMMSFLAKVETPFSGSKLSAFYWQKGPFQTRPRHFESHGDSSYFMGQGVPVPWDKSQPLEVRVCGISSPELRKLVAQGAMDWSKILSQFVHIRVEVVDEYPPFTDLNFHCIQIVDNYLLEEDPQYMKPAVTYVQPNYRSHFIQDADILFFRKEREKLDQNMPDEMILRDVRHEMGHLLGLGHVFDKNIESIMSYDDSICCITIYDGLIASILYSSPVAKAN